MVATSKTPEDLRLSLCVTCKDRGRYAEITLKENLALIRGSKNTEIVFLDYNSGDGIGDHVKKHMLMI